MVSADDYNLSSPLEFNVSRMGFLEYMATYDVPGIEGNVKEIFGQGHSPEHAIFKLFNSTVSNRNELNENNNLGLTHDTHIYKTHLNDIIRDIE